MLKLDISKISMNRFFDTVSQCQSPVLLQSPDGKCEDLRGNSFLWYVLSISRGDKQFISLDLHPTNNADTEKLLQFAMGQRI